MNTKVSDSALGKALRELREEAQRECRECAEQEGYCARETGTGRRLCAHEALRCILEAHRRATRRARRKT